jgi:pimeloyl-ACP methyl ester carboxylesterase
MPELSSALRPAEIRHSFAEVNDIRLHTAAAGAGKLILFLHGFPEFWYAWKNQLAEFGRDHLAVAPDMRGYNLSSRPADVEKYQMAALVEDVRDLAEHFTRERFILVGHDWGGVIAWAFALLYPQHLERLIIVNAPHPAIFERELRENPAQQRASQYMLLFRSPQAEQVLSAGNFSFMKASILQPLVAQGHFNEEDCKAYLEAWSQPGALTGGLNYYRAAKVGPPDAPGSVTEPLGTVLSSLTTRVPTLVIWGEKDPYLLMGNLTGLQRYVQDLQVRLIADGTHWVIHEKSAVVNSYIRAFLENTRENATPGRA